MALTPTTPKIFSEEQAREDYRASPALQAEFRQEAAYVAFMRAESSGAYVRYAGRGNAATAVRPGAADAPTTAQAGPSGVDEAQLRAEFESDATIRADFPTFTSYVAYSRAYHSGRVKKVGDKPFQ